MHCILIAGYGCSGKSSLAKRIQGLSSKLSMKSDVIPQALFIKKFFSAYFGRSFEKTIKDREDVTDLAWALKGQIGKNIDTNIIKQEIEALGLNSSKIKTTEFFPDLSHQLAVKQNLDLLIIDDLRYPKEQKYFLESEEMVLTIKTNLDDHTLNKRILKKYGHTLEQLKQIESEQHYHEIKEDFIVNTDSEDYEMTANLDELLKEFLQG